MAKPGRALGIAIGKRPADCCPYEHAGVNRLSFLGLKYLHGELEKPLGGQWVQVARYCLDFFAPVRTAPAFIDAELPTILPHDLCVANMRKQCLWGIVKL